MAIPKYHQIMLPILQMISDGKRHSFSDIIPEMAKFFQVSETERKEILPSGGQAVFDNRVGWARTYLKKAGLLDAPERGIICITDRGQSVLKENIQEITPKYLKKFEEFQEFQNIGKRKKDEVDESDGPELLEGTPQEMLENAYKVLTNGLVSDILLQIEKCSPFFFEKLVVDLLINMGYGGSRKEAGEAFQTSGDGGIDGIIKEDRLGLDVIFIQAKRWNKDSVVGRPEIQKFVGALQGVRAKKGIFITTTRFTKDAREYVNQIETKIILIDGSQLAEYMIDSDTGVSTSATYKLKKLDLDYFQDIG